MKAESPEKMQREHVAATSGDVLETQIARLREVFPEAVVEGKIDWEKLRITLGAAAESGPGRFLFTWAGRDDAVSLLQTPSRATLIPCPEESVNFEGTGNAFIEGDNLEVLKLLFKPYFGRVKLIYIDPPYNTGQDFVYPDNYADPLKTYLQITGQVDTEGNLLTSNPETSGRYHSTWLSMMYPRLFLARQLLDEDGVICVSIDDHEVHHLRMLMNEVFGEENFVEQFVWKRSYGGGAKEKYAVSQHEYVVMYCRSLEDLPALWLPPDPEVEKKYYKNKDSKFETRGGYRLQPLEAGKSMDRRENLIFPIPPPEGPEIWPKRQWLWRKERVFKAIANDELVFTETDSERTVSYKQYLLNEDGEKRGAKLASVIDGIYTQHGTQELIELFDGAHPIQFPKPSNLIKQFIRFGTDSEDLILDFFAGSCSTAQGVLELNREDGGSRRFIMIQLPEPTGTAQYKTIAEIGKERIRRVIGKLKKDSAGRLQLNEQSLPEDLGFKIFKLAEPNVQQWPMEEESDPETYAQKILAFNDPLVPGWKPENVIWEVALREGFSLNARFAPKELPNGNTVYEVTDPDSGQQFWICLDEKIRADMIKQCELTQDRLFICRDVALDDSAAANLALQCRLKTI
jgi:adenine-specific DNA-methyltransferase